MKRIMATLTVFALMGAVVVLAVLLATPSVMAIMVVHGPVLGWAAYSVLLVTWIFPFTGAIRTWKSFGTKLDKK